MSALFNPTFWLTILLLGAALWPGPGDAAQRCRALSRAATRPAVLMLLTVLTVTNVGARAALGHAVPGDFVQEVIGARRFAEEGALYSVDVNADVREWLAAEPPPLWSWLPSPAVEPLRARQQTGRNRLVAQAHPPTLLLAFAPLVLWVGAYPTFWILTAFTVAAVVLGVGRIVAALWPAASRAERWLILMAVLGWQPVLAAIRDGQVSVLIGVLMIAGWAGMRERAGGGSGVAIGIAAALKLYPALLLALLALRRRAALVAALITMVASATIVSLIAGAQAWADFARAAAIIAASFAGEPHNLAVVARLAGVTPSGWLLAAYVATSVVMLLATIAVVLRRERSRAQCHTTDLEFALFISLAFLLSPVAWHHYVFMLAQPLAVALAAAITSRGRLAIGAWAAAVLLLSVPDDALRGFQAALPDHNVVLAAASPGAIVLLLWAMLLHLRRQSEERVLHRSRLAIGTI